MKPALRELLVSPCCRAELDLENHQQDRKEVRSGALTCRSCGRRFPIAGGVPDLLIGRELPRTRQSFTAQWRLRFGGAFERQATLYGQDYQELVRWWLARCLGQGSAGDWMLDAGCGTGEKAMVAAEQNPELEVVGLDMADTIRLSAERGAGLPNLHFVQGDVMHPPFRENCFAKLVSWGVLHCTRDTHQAFRSVARLLRRGGRMVVWIYPDPAEDELAAKYYRIRDQHFFGCGHVLPPRLLLWSVRLYCFLLAPVLLYQYKRRIIPQFRGCGYVPIEGARLLDLYRSVVFILYDDLAPEFQFRHRRSEVMEWFASDGFAQVETDRLGHYWGERA